jgi:acetyl-CoA C-acetyltransferase/acetyl-CoA acyltransferase
MSERLVIIDGVRTPFCKAGTELASLSADDLGRIAVDALLTRTGLDPALIDEVIFGCVCQPAEASNIARVIALRAGIPDSVPAVTVHRNCASGFESFTTAYERLASDRGSVFVVGGTESMSRVPMIFQNATARKFAELAKSKSTKEKLTALASFRVADFEPRATLMLGLTDPVCGLNMGETADLLAREDGITREQQDAFALQSHQRALAAEARLDEEICPIYLGSKPINRDNGPRAGSSMAALGALRPVFEKYGSVTAGNSSQISDGAAALLVMSESRAKELGFKPLGALTAYAYAGCDPAHMGLGPVAAIDRVAKKCQLTPADADIVEINEAFASQVLAVLSRVKPEIPQDKLNVNGGAIALGHPVGATGARLILTSLKELARRNGKRALVSLCVGGGQGGAIWLERI